MAEKDAVTATANGIISLAERATMTREKENNLTRNVAY